MIKGVCLDWDGTLVNSEPVWFEVHRNVFARYGIQITEEDHKNYWISTDSRRKKAAAGMSFIAAPNKWTEDGDFSRADAVVKSLNEITLEIIKEIEANRNITIAEF